MRTLSIANTKENEDEHEPRYLMEAEDTLSYRSALLRQMRSLNNVFIALILWNLDPTNRCVIGTRYVVKT